MQASLFDKNNSVLPLVPRSSVWQETPLTAFEQWIRVATYQPAPGRERRYSVASQRSYLTIFRHYLRHLDAYETSLVAATASDVNRFLQNLNGRLEDGSASYETVRRTLTLLDRVYCELSRLRIRSDNPTKALFAHYTRQPPQQPRSTVLLPSQQQSLIEYITGLPRDDFESARRAALLSLLAGCGLTGSELLALPAKDVALHETPPRVFMPTAGARAEATIALARFAVPVVSAYAAFLNAAEPRSERFFPAALGSDKHVSLQTLHRYVVAALKAVGLHERVGAQRILRASFAVRLLEHVPDQKAKEILRLRGDKMIERYRRHVVTEMPF